MTYQPESDYELMDLAVKLEAGVKPKIEHQ